MPRPELLRLAKLDKFTVPFFAGAALRSSALRNPIHDSTGPSVLRKTCHIGAQLPVLSEHIPRPNTDTTGLERAIDFQVPQLQCFMPRLCPVQISRGADNRSQEFPHKYINLLQIVLVDCPSTGCKTSNWGHHLLEKVQDRMGSVY